MSSLPVTKQRRGQRKLLSAFTLALSAAAAICLSGCEGGATTYSVAQLSNPSVRARAASDYWVRHAVPSDLSRYGYRRVAILDFAVEFVTERLEAPFESEPMAGPLAPVPSAENRVGLSRKRATYPADVYRDLPNDMYAMFIDAFEAAGLQAIEPDKVRTARAYRRVTTGAMAQIDLSAGLQQTASDLGRIQDLRAYPSRHIELLGGPKAGEELETVELALLEELNADVCMRVRLRVGVQQGRATVERGSVIWVLTRDQVGNISADRSLRSESWVIDEAQFEALKGEVYAVSAPKYHDAIREVFPPYIMMAFESD